MILAVADSPRSVGGVLLVVVLLVVLFAVRGGKK